MSLTLALVRSSLSSRKRSLRNDILGEWLAYTVDVNLDGLYRVDINLGQTAPGGTYHLEMDSVPLFAPQQVRDSFSTHESG